MEATVPYYLYHRLLAFRLLPFLNLFAPDDSHHSDQLEPHRTSSVGSARSCSTR